jgi:hypothetical protein
MRLSDTKPGETAREGRWIRIVAEQPRPRTAVFSVLSKYDPYPIGTVRWYGAWLKYVFEPAPGTIFESVCLGEIEKFLEDLMEERKR